ncbi:Trehalose transport system permease protein SugB [subsurface metagenome]
MIKIIIMFIIILIFLFPYYWMVSLSLEPASVALEGKPHWFPQNITLANYLFMFRLRWFPKWLFNSIFIPGMAVILTCLSASMAGYVLAKKKFPGNQFIFFLMIATMAIPVNTILLPRFFGDEKAGAD